MGKKTLILGVGNPILGDDGAGIAAAKELAKSRLDCVDVKEAENVGLDILNAIQGYDAVIIVDAVVAKKEKPGRIIRLENPERAMTAHTSSSMHDVNFSSAMEIGRKLGMKIPKITVYGINVEQEKMEKFGEGLSPEIENAVKKAAKAVLREINHNI